MPYFQDEWKVTPSFTVDLGLRWEYYGVAMKLTIAPRFSISMNFMASAWFGFKKRSLSHSDQHAPCPKNPALYNPDYKNFDPRVSIAWAPTCLHGKTVIRAGFGIYHGAAQNDDLNAGLGERSVHARTSFNPSGAGTPLLPEYQRRSRI